MLGHICRHLDEWLISLHWELWGLGPCGPFFLLLPSMPWTGLGPQVRRVSDGILSQIVDAVYMAEVELDAKVESVTDINFLKALCDAVSLSLISKPHVPPAFCLLEKKAFRGLPVGV